jgi:hypothetical protein
MPQGHGAHGAQAQVGQHRTPRIRERLLQSGTKSAPRVTFVTPILYRCTRSSRLIVVFAKESRFVDMEIIRPSAGDVTTCADRLGRCALSVHCFLTSGSLLRPPLLHSDGQRFSSRFGKTAFCDWSLSGWRLRGRCSWSRRSRSFRRLDRRPALLCSSNNRPSARGTQFSFRWRFRTGRFRVRLDRRRYRLSTGTRRCLCCGSTLKSVYCCG